MSEKVTTSFPTMGDHGIPDSFVNMSGQRSPYTQVGPGMGGPGKNAGPDSAGGVRKSTEIENANGPRLAPVTKIYEGNAAEANSGLRNVQIMPSAAGVSDFWGQRAVRGKI
jgi:hypothetical protein